MSDSLGFNYRRIATVLSCLSTNLSISSKSSKAVSFRSLINPADIISYQSLSSSCKAASSDLVLVS